MTDRKPAPSTTLSAAQRQAILEEYDSYPRGDIRRVELLQRHGVYTSHLAKWRQRLKEGRSIEPRPPGPAPQPVNPLAAEVARLQRENARLQRKLEQAELIIAAQKKVATLLDMLSSEDADDQR